MSPTADATPSSDLDDVTYPTEATVQMTEAEAESLRRMYLTHEGRLQTIGSLMLLGAPILLVGPPLALFGLLGLLSALISGEHVASNLGAALPLLVIGPLLTWMGVLITRAGIGLRRLNPEHRGLFTVILCFWLWSFSVISLLGLWALYLIYSPEGRIVLSPTYQEARLLTPDIQHKTSLVTWLVLLLVGVGGPRVLVIRSLP